MIACENPLINWAFLYRQMLRQIENSYRISISNCQISRDISTNRNTGNKNDTKVRRANWSSIYNRPNDDDDCVLYECDEEDIKNLMEIVMQSFTILLNHFIETQIGEMLPDKRYQQDKAIYWLRECGWMPDEKILNQLRLSANCIKHGEGSSSRQLFACRPDMFDSDVEEWGLEPSHLTLNIQSNHMDEFFEAAREAVPKVSIRSYASWEEFEADGPLPKSYIPLSGKN